MSDDAVPQVGSWRSPLEGEVAAAASCHDHITGGTRWSCGGWTPQQVEEGKGKGGEGETEGQREGEGVSEEGKGREIEKRGRERGKNRRVQC